MQCFPLVSLAMLDYNGLEYLGGVLRECTDSVLETNYPDFEVIFVDNRSADGSIDFAKKQRDSEMKIVHNDSNLSFSWELNTGTGISEGRYVALLNNDMTVDPNGLKPIVRIVESDHMIGLAGFKRFVRGTKDLLDGIGGNLYLCGRAKPIGRRISIGQHVVIGEDLDCIGGAMGI